MSEQTRTRLSWLFVGLTAVVAAMLFTLGAPVGAALPAVSLSGAPLLTPLVTGTPCGPSVGACSAGLPGSAVSAERSAARCAIPW